MKPHDKTQSVQSYFAKTVLTFNDTTFPHSSATVLCHNRQVPATYRPKYTYFITN